MSSSSLQQETIQQIVADDGDLYFVESPFYWQNSNPSALAKTWNGYLRTVGCENSSESADAPEDKTEFESEIIGTNAAIEDFRKFISDGQKFGTINITNSDADSTLFEMLKRMYGSIAYVVLEERAISADDPRKKHKRRAAFFSEYDLCALNERCYRTDDSYYYAITEKRIPSIVTSSGQLSKQAVETESSMDLTRKKMYRNGFKCLQTDQDKGIYSRYSCPTKEEYLSNQKREQLGSQDMMNLLWKVISDIHPEYAEDPIGRDTFKKKLANELYSANIVGFGWLPCLFAKKDLNELDRYVLYLYDKCGFHNDMHKAAQCEEQESHTAPGSHKILVFKDMSNDKFHPTERYPLDKIVKINRAPHGLYQIVDVNGKEMLTDYVDLVDDIPQVDIKISPEIPGKYIVTGRYADGRCIKYEMDERDWKEHSYEIEKYIPGSLNAIKAYNLKQMSDNGEFFIPVYYSTPLKWEDNWNNIKVSDYYSSPQDIIYSQLPIPEYTYGSNGTYNDLIQANK